MTSPFDSILHSIDDNKCVLKPGTKLSLICRSKSADVWFQMLESVQSAVGEIRKDNQKRVRIAILDTGVDITHPQIQAA